jgi:hypothetical protein
VKDSSIALLAWQGSDLHSIVCDAVACVSGEALSHGSFQGGRLCIGIQALCCSPGQSPYATSETWQATLQYLAHSGTAVGAASDLAQLQELKKFRMKFKHT